eukprot:TRINITY_DN2180_c0_g2_i1.p1 TRINITY_DN2180_c0_g2~~TRINITY_DN2180_c0_g2_i1.p1  ORF type:complete len:241 (-),score=34.75 TRINITY_DN2180_c0_g2_i1:736-1458(-)
MSGKSEDDSCLQSSVQLKFDVPKTRPRASTLSTDRVYASVAVPVKDFEEELAAARSKLNTAASFKGVDAPVFPEVKAVVPKSTVVEWPIFWKNPRSGSKSSYLLQFDARRGLDGLRRVIFKAINVAPDRQSIRVHCRNTTFHVYSQRFDLERLLRTNEDDMRQKASWIEVEEEVDDESKKVRKRSHTVPPVTLGRNVVPVMHFTSVMAPMWDTGRVVEAPKSYFPETFLQNPFAKRSIIS